MIQSSLSWYARTFLLLAGEFFLFVIGICFSLILNAQVSKSVIATAGGLSSALTTAELQTITNLILTGTIDAQDFKTMRDDMPMLAIIDISDAIIAVYNGIKGTSMYTNYYPSNTLPECAFFDNSAKGKKSLTSILLPHSLIALGSYSFDDCTGLNSIIIPSSVTNIGYMAFSHCSGLTTIEIPSSVISIGYMAFFSCSGLTTVEIPSSVNSIEDSAFYFCSGLTTVMIPSSVTSIGNQVFWGCSSLTTIAIPSSVTSIGIGAFGGCSGLTTVVIPSSVSSIGAGAFDFCSGLTEIIASSPNPVYFTSFAYVFEHINKTTCTLYVPVGSKSAYQTANVWKDFTNIVEDPKIPTGLEPIINEKHLTAYPNPTIGRVKLILDQIPQNGTYLTITDVTGRMILKQLMLNKEELIDLQGNSPGVYLITTNLENFKVQKVILK